MKGVNIYLEPGIRVPLWLKVQDRYVSVENVEITHDHGARKVRRLTIRSGSARFYPGGQVGILTPSSRYERVAFTSDQVLSFEDLLTKKVTANRYLCSACFRLTGEEVSETNGGARRKMKCRACSHKWEWSL